MMGLAGLGFKWILIKGVGLKTIGLDPYTFIYFGPESAGSQKIELMP